MTEAIKIFVSVGRTRDNTHEDFVAAIEARLRAEGLQPYTVRSQLLQERGAANCGR